MFPAAGRLRQLAGGRFLPNVKCRIPRMSNNLAHALIGELERESVATQRLLERVPVDQADWRPHPRSTALGALAWHVANIPRRVSSMVAAGSFNVLNARPGAGGDHNDY